MTPPDTKAELIEAILAHVEEGKSLTHACKLVNFERKNFEYWADHDPALASRYARARESRAERIFEEILIIADTPQIGTTKTAKEWGTEIKTGDMIEHRRLQVDARKWILAKMAPKKYGDRVEVDHSGRIDTGADLSKLSTEELATLRALRAKASTDAPSDS